MLEVKKETGTGRDQCSVIYTGHGYELRVRLIYNTLIFLKTRIYYCLRTPKNLLYGSLRSLTIY